MGNNGGGGRIFHDMKGRIDRMKDDGGVHLLINIDSKQTPRY